MSCFPTCASNWSHYWLLLKGPNYTTLFLYRDFKILLVLKYYNTTLYTTLLLTNCHRIWTPNGRAGYEILCSIRGETLSWVTRFPDFSTNFDMYLGRPVATYSCKKTDGQIQYEWVVCYRLSLAVRLTKGVFERLRILDTWAGVRRPPDKNVIPSTRSPSQWNISSVYGD